MEESNMNKINLRNSDGKIYTGWYIVLMGVLLMSFAYSCVVSVSGVFMVPVTEELGIKIGDFSIWVTIMSIVSIIFLSVISKVFSQKTIKKLMIICCFCGIAGFLGFATSNSLMQFYISSVPLGICFGGLTTTPSALLVNNWFPASIRGKALGFLFGGNSLLVMGLIPVINAVVQNLGWRTAYYALAATLLVICLPLIIRFAIWSPEMTGEKLAGASDSEEEVVSGEKAEGISFKDGLKSPATWLMFISGTLLVIASSAILGHSQPFLMMNGYSAIFASNVTSIMIGICVVTCAVVGALNDRYGLKAAVIISSISFVLAYIAQIFIPGGGIIMVALFILFYGIGCPAVNIVSPLFASHMFGPKDVGAFIGYINLFISMGGAIGISLVGKLYDITGTYITPFWICAGILFVSFLIRIVCASEKYSYKNRIK